MQAELERQQKITAALTKQLVQMQSFLAQKFHYTAPSMDILDDEQASYEMSRQTCIAESVFEARWVTLLNMIEEERAVRNKELAELKACLSSTRSTLMDALSLFSEAKARAAEEPEQVCLEGPVGPAPVKPGKTLDKKPVIRFVSGTPTAEPKVLNESRSPVVSTRQLDGSGSPPPTWRLTPSASPTSPMKAMPASHTWTSRTPARSPSFRTLGQGLEESPSLKALQPHPFQAHAQAPVRFNNVVVNPHLPRTLLGYPTQRQHL